MFIQGRDRYHSLLSLVSGGHGSISTLSDSGSLPAYPFGSPGRSIVSGNSTPNPRMHKRNVNENYSEEISADANQSDAGKPVAVACVENNVPKRQRTSTTCWIPFSSTGRRSSVEQGAFGRRELGSPPRRFQRVLSEFSQGPSPERPVSPKCFSRHVQGVTRGLQHGRDCSNLYTWRRGCPQSRFFRRMNLIENYSKEIFGKNKVVYPMKFTANTMQSGAEKAIGVRCVENDVPKRQRKSRTRWRPFSSTGRRSSVLQSPSNRWELGSPPTQPKIPSDISVSASPKWTQL